MSLTLAIEAIQYPQVDGTVTRTADGAVVSVSGHYATSGSTDTEKQQNLEVEMFKRGKLALVDYDRQKQIDDQNAEIQKSIDPIANSQVNQPTAPTAPTVTTASKSGQLTVSGTADSATTRLVLTISGQGEEDVSTETQTDEDGNETEVEVDNTVRVYQQETFTGSQLPDYSLELTEPTIEVKIESVAYNAIDDSASTEITWAPAAGGGDSGAE